MKIDNLNSYKNFGVGGVELVKLMDKRMGLSDTLSGMKSKGVPLDSIAKAIISEWIVNPNSILSTRKNIIANDEIIQSTGMKNVDVKTFYRALDILGKHSEEIHAKIVENLKTEIDMSVVFIDWSSSFFYGKECKIAKKGYSRDHRPDKEQIKVCFAVNGKQKIPLHHSVMPGNVHDALQFKHDFVRIKDIAPKGSIIVLDKGADSKENRKAITESGRHFVTAAKMNEPMKKKIQNINRAVMKEILTHKNGKKVYAYEWFDGTHHTLYFDEQRYESDRKKRGRRIAKALKEYEEMEKLLAKRGAKAVRKKLSKKIKRLSYTGEYIIQHNTSIQKRLAPKSDLLATLNNDAYLDGMFVLDSDIKIKPKKKLKLYRKKDVIEKLISDIKSVMKLRPFRVRRENEVAGCVLLKIISLTMIALLQMDNNELRSVSKSTVINILKTLTLTVKISTDGTRTVLGYANTTEILVKIFSLGT